VLDRSQVMEGLCYLACLTRRYRLQGQLMKYTKHIVRAIAAKYPHLNPQPSAKNDSQLLIPLPPLTKETRVENQKKVKEIGETKKTMVRNIRHDHLKLIKKAAKDDPGMGKDVVTRIEKEVEKEIKSTLEEVEKLSERFQRDIMTA
jgi:ribosome recycling factor